MIKNQLFAFTQRMEIPTQKIKIFKSNLDLKSCFLPNKFVKNNEAYIFRGFDFLILIN